MSLRAAGRPGQSNRNSRPRTAQPMTSSAPQSLSTGTRRWPGRLLTTVGTINQGAAYVFTRSGTTWTEQQKLTASDGGANDFFGTSVAIDGDTAVAGAPGDDNGARGTQARPMSLRAAGRIGHRRRNSRPRTARPMISSALSRYRRGHRSGRVSYCQGRFEPPGARLTSLRATERSGTNFRNSWPRTARSVTSSASQSQ